MLKNRTIFFTAATAALIVVVFFADSLDTATDIPEPMHSEPKMFSDFSLPQPTIIKEFPTSTTVPCEKPYQYAVVDLDADGIEELLVEYDKTGDIAIINTQNGTINSYRISHRSCLNLKVDGTMGWSNSANESGVHRLSFSENGISSKDVIVYNTGDGIFKVSDKLVTEEDCIAALREHWSKPNVKWNSIR